MRAKLAARLEALETRAHGAGGPWLSVTYDQGEAPERIAALEAEALAAFVAERGAPRGAVSYIHRVIQSPRPHQREAANV